MASFHCTGRADVYVDLGPGPMMNTNTPPANTPVFLGNCETAPELEFREAWKDVMNDAAGRMLPIDRQFHGNDAIITIDLNRFNMGVLQSIQARTSKLPSSPGLESPIARGTFLITNGIAFRVWIKNSFYGTVNAADYIASGSSLNPGWFFPACCYQTQFPTVIGTDTHKVRLVLQAHPWWDVVSQDFYLYNSTDPALFQNLPAIN